jgi:hypothetical protein
VEIQNELMQFFIVQDFIAHNKYLPLSPRRQALIDYRENVSVQERVHAIVEPVLAIIERGKANDKIRLQEGRRQMVMPNLCP